MVVTTAVSYFSSITTARAATSIAATPRVEIAAAEAAEAAEAAAAAEAYSRPARLVGGLLESFTHGLLKRAGRRVFPLYLRRRR